MSLETMTEEQDTVRGAAGRQIESDNSEPTEPRRRLNPFLIGATVLVLLASGISWYAYGARFEDTDDAQIDGHLNPIASRIDGTIKAVHVDDNQGVKAGMLLVELDPSEDEIALEQTQAQPWRN
jgi:membrane fusion protein (multidrug efflux system)